MCGIAGVLDPRRRIGTDEVRRVVEEMAGRLTHRGPDDHGSWVSDDGLCALSHRRLSIIDTSRAGRQPMAANDGRLVIVFNGEIYNYREVRTELARRGVRFSTRTDTEALLQAFASFGRDSYARLEGMYAFAIFDTVERRLTLARDPFGQKPLYYTTRSGAIAFASELGALRAVPWFEGEIASERIADYLVSQYVPAPGTIYRETFKVEPGTWVEFRADGSSETGRHFEFQPRADGVARTQEERLEHLNDVVAQAVAESLVSDVPLGTLLSSGVDSSLVTAVARQAAGVPLKTYSIGFEGSADSEHVAAASSAEHLSCEHTSRILPATALEHLSSIVAAMDEPNGDPSCLPTYLLAAHARRDVTVVLSGDGGDELFGGYDTYLALIREFDVPDASAAPRRTVGEAYVSMMSAFSVEELQLLLGGTPQATCDRLSDLAARIDSFDGPLISRVRWADSSTYLPGAVLAKVDRMSMASALEVRCPLLSRRVATVAAGLHPSECVEGGLSKVMLRRLASRYLPADWMNRPKKGFGLPAGWPPATLLLKIAERHFSNGRPLLCDWMDRASLEAFVRRQRRPYTFEPVKIWRLIVLETWLQTHAAAARESARWAPPVAPSRTSATADELLLHAVHPATTPAGVAFNVQADGRAALSVSCGHVGPWASIFWNEHELPTTFATAASLTAIVPPALYGVAGSYSIHVQDGDRRSNSLRFEVTSSESESSKPLVLTALSPDHITAGTMFNMQPSGASAFAVTAENASSTTRVYLDGTGLETTVGSPSFLTALLPERMILSPRTYQVHLRDGARVSNAIPFRVTGGPSPSLDSHASPEGSTRPLRIAFIVPRFMTEYEGGLATYVDRMTQALVGRGHQPSVFCLSGNEPRFVDYYGVPVHRVPPVEARPDSWFARAARLHPLLDLTEAVGEIGGAWRLAQALSAREQESSFDLVHCSDIGLTTLFVRKATRPLITRCSWSRDLYRRVDGAARTPGGWLVSMLERLSIRRADVAYAPSRFLADYMDRNYGIQLKVLRPPFSLERPPAGEIPADLPPRYLMFLGFLNKRKGTDTLAAALPLVWQEAPDFTMVWAGSEYPKPVFEGYVRKWGDQANRVRWIGEVSKPILYEVLRRAEASVIPSLCDNLPNAAIESLALAVPVIGTIGTSLDELVEPGTSGFLVQPEDAQALAGAMLKVWRGERGWRHRPGILEDMEPDRAAGNLLALAGHPAELRSPLMPRDAAPLTLARLAPDRTSAKGAFNRQPDGSSALSIECRNAGFWTTATFDGVPLKTTYGGPTWLTALVLDELLQDPGRHRVQLVDERLGVSNVLEFVVERE